MLTRVWSRVVDVDQRQPDQRYVRVLLSGTKRENRRERYNGNVSNVIRQIVALSSQWPTLDPFLFCAHHNDRYPNGNGSFGPAVSLAGREIGSDFSGLDGWNMYHGTEIPGFPQHPHRGFETVTLVRRGLIDHADSLGATARFGDGDVQWLTAGSGIVHSEMFPLLDEHSTNPLELFQIWVNLPSADKMVDPYFTMLWSDDIPIVEAIDMDGHLTTITIVVGQLNDTRTYNIPPNSWAAQDESDVAIWTIRMEPNACWTLPRAASDATQRVLYHFEGDELLINDESLPPSHGGALVCDKDLILRAGPSGAECLLLQGRPIGEPVARYGPFVMNTEAEIQQAFADYQKTQFGGWPWPVDGPAHSAETPRFACHPDGRREHPGASVTPTGNRSTQTANSV